MNKSDLPPFDIPEPDLIETIKSLEKEARELRKKNSELCWENASLRERLRVIDRVFDKLLDLWEDMYYISDLVKELRKT